MFLWQNCCIAKQTQINELLKPLLKGLTADAANPDLVAFEHAFDTDHVIDRVIGPMIDRVIHRVIELDYVSAIVQRPLVWTIDS